MYLCAYVFIYAYRGCLSLEKTQPDIRTFHLIPLCKNSHCNKRADWKQLIQRLKRVPPCVTSKYPAWHVCTGSSLVSRSSSSNIKGIHLQLRCLSASKSWSHPAKKNNGVFSPSRCPLSRALSCSVGQYPGVRSQRRH